MHFEGICGLKQELNYPFNHSFTHWMQRYYPFSFGREHFVPMRHALI